MGCAELYRHAACERAGHGVCGPGVSGAREESGEAGAGGGVDEFGGSEEGVLGVLCLGGIADAGDVRKRGNEGGLRPEGVETREMFGSGWKGSGTESK